MNLGGSGVATVPSSALPPVKERVDEASGADPDKSSVRDVAQPPPHSRPDVAQVQHYDPGMGQSATKDEGRRVSGCLRIMTVLGRDRLRWWRYDDLGLAAGVRLGSVRTRCSNLRNAKPPVDFEERVVDGFREIRLGVR